MISKNFISMALIGMVLQLMTGSAFASDDGKHLHNHHASVFVGNTTNYKGQNALTFGLDYEYRLNHSWGLVALADHAGGDIQSTVVAAGAMLHPLSGLRLQVAPGLELHHDKAEFVVRWGTLYDFRVGDWTLSPSVYLDVLEMKKNLIFGLGLGHGF